MNIHQENPKSLIGVLELLPKTNMSSKRSSYARRFAFLGKSQQTLLRTPVRAIKNNQAVQKVNFKRIFAIQNGRAPGFIGTNYRKNRTDIGLQRKGARGSVP
jgi:hypothetical protein